LGKKRKGERKKRFPKTKGAITGRKQNLGLKGKGGEIEGEGKREKIL